MLKNNYYICHYCCDYYTHKLKDIKQHTSRKNKCKCNSLMSYDECMLLSVSKKFIFSFNINELTIDDISFIIKNYNDQINIINKNYKSFILNNIKKENLINEDSIKEDLKYDNNDYLKQKYFDNDIIKLLYLNKFKDNNLNIINDKNNEIIDDKNNTNLDSFDNRYFNKEKNKYICNLCFTEYTSKQNMEKHLLNKNKCDKRRQIRDAIDVGKQTQQLVLQKKTEEDSKYKAHLLQQNNQFIQTQNNIQNNNNTNNNTHNSTYNLSINDFVNERYDITHIKDSFYEQKDFFIYPNFLNMIMQNKKNHNLFFANGEAVFYSDNEINKMSSDKAGYLVLDKLSQSFEELFSKQDEETKEYYKFINKYYHVVKGHYKHDTILKDYDVETRQFFYTSQGNLFRSRDKYLSKITTTVNKYSDEVRNEMNVSGIDIKNIPLINPNIEDFASVKMRYRDLKDRD